MATVAEQFWREILDVRRPLAPIERRRSSHNRTVLVRSRASAKRPAPSRRLGSNL
jgi:hypothetical protein